MTNHEKATVALVCSLAVAGVAHKVASDSAAELGLSTVAVFVVGLVVNAAVTRAVTS